MRLLKEGPCKTTMPLDTCPTCGHEIGIPIDETCHCDGCREAAVLYRCSSCHRYLVLADFDLEDLEGDLTRIICKSCKSSQ